MTTLTFTAMCKTCKRHTTITVLESAFVAWQEGMLIQRAMPQLTPGERELLINEICGECYDKLCEESESE